MTTAESEQNIHPRFIDDMFLGINPKSLNDIEKQEGATLFLHVLIKHNHGFRDTEDPEEAPKEYLDQLKPETKEKIRTILIEHVHGNMPENSRIGQLGEAVLEYLEKADQEVEV